MCYTGRAERGDGMRRKLLTLAAALALLLSGCAGRDAAKRDMQEEKTQTPGQIQETTQTEPTEPSIYQPEPGQWAAYASAYDAYFLSEPPLLPLFGQSVYLQMIDLDQNGVPELVVYHGVSTALMVFAIFTVEDDTVKSLTEALSWNWAMPTTDGSYEIPRVSGAMPFENQEILCDSSYLCLDSRVLPFGWDYGAFSARMDAQTGEPFWLFSCLKNQRVTIDGDDCNLGGEYWRFENQNGEIQPELLLSFGLDWDDSQPYSGFSQETPDEARSPVQSDVSTAPVVNGEMSRKITEHFLAARDAASPALTDAPEACRLTRITGQTQEERLLQVRAFFASFE